MPKEISSRTGDNASDIYKVPKILRHVVYECKHS